MSTPLEREAIASLTNAKQHMDAVLKRIAILEYALKTLAQRHKQMTSYVPDAAYSYDSKHKVREIILEQAAEAEKVLGQGT